MSKLLERTLKLFYPDRCLFCDRAVEAGGFCCGRCRDTLPTISPDHCIYCGNPLSHCRCGSGVARPYVWQIAVFAYTGSVRRGVAAFKFGGRKEAGAYFAGLLAQQIESRVSPLPFDLITCVPMSAKKEAQRGYNQADVLAQELSRLLTVDCNPHLLYRSGILTQHDLSGRFRRRGAKAAFHACEGIRIQGRHILLVDDIATTGATMEQCAWSLKDAGAAAVYCAVIAQAPTHGKSVEQ